MTTKATASPRSAATTFLLSPDITNPEAPIHLVDPADGHIVETKLGGLEFASVETTDGISRLLTADGKQLEQYPGIHAGFSAVEGRGVYGRCIVDGCRASFKTRPEDQGFVYTFMRLP